jgi:hypothetical protein
MSGHLSREELAALSTEAQLYYRERFATPNGAGPGPAERAPGLRVVPITEFAAVDEPSAEPLLGDDDTTVLSRGGMMVIYGKGGGGKTTLEVDLAVHLAAGTAWLGLPVPRPCRVLLLENEGPRGKFRRKLRAKLAAWTGPDVQDRLFVVDEPWATFTFADERMRAELAAVVREHAIDVLAAGPVQRLGVTGGGTPEEVAAFVGLIEQVRAQLDRPLAGTFVHHENKAGTLSGAWEGIPDTTMHISAQGNGATRVEWEKVRWGSDLHGRTWKLLWRDGEGFELDEKPEVTDEDRREAILAAVLAAPGCTAKAVEKACGGNAERIRAIRDALLDEGALVNLGGGKGGVGGGGMKLCRPGDEAIVQHQTIAQTIAPSPPGAPRRGTDRPSSARKEERRTDDRSPGAPADERGRDDWCQRCERRRSRGAPGEPYCQCDEDDLRWESMAGGAS